MGMDKATALKISGPFGGGMAAMGETCGAVTGAFMVIGLRYGKTKADDDAAKQKSYAVVREFVEKFMAKHGSIVCRELAGCDLNTPDGKREFEERRVGKTLCPKLVQDAAEILEEIF
jgi:C_GCAxxG_C_C family probable redox protein